MTKSEFEEMTEEPSAGPLLLKRALITVVGAIALLFIAGMIAGFSSVAFRNGAPGFRGFAILGAMVLIGVAVAYAMWRLWPRGLDGPVAPRVKSARNLLIASVLVSLPIGVVLGISDSGNAAGMFSNAPVSPALAISVIALWSIVMPIITWLWWKSIDEHEARAYREGGMIAVHAYMFVTPAWWMAARAGWLPPLEPMIVLLAVSLVWALIWFVRRFF